MRKWITCTIMAVMMAAMIFMGTGNNVFANDEVTYDSNMQTKKFDVDVKVGEDGSYTVTENIKVKFVNPRHGIYRYIPYKGKVITSDKNGDQKKLLYYADFTLLSNDSKTDVDEDSDGNSQVLRFGSADYTVSKGNYRFTYQLIPKYQGDTYDYLYYNIFPTLWRNKIPEGSTFTIHFPKKTDLKGVNFYYGRYGESKYAKDVISNNRFHRLLVSGNPVIAGFLYGKLSSIQEQGIEVTYTFHISEFTSKIPVYLVVELIGNLLKNAVEAVKTQQVEKQIHLSCTENENEFCLGVRNRSEKIPFDEMGRFFEKGYSSKGSGRGLGLYNVKEICEKYGVDIVCDNTEIDDKNWFFIELHIKKSDETNLRNKSEKVSK